MYIEKNIMLQCSSLSCKWKELASCFSQHYWQ